MPNLPVPVPGTQASGNFLTSALWNAQVRDAVNFLTGPPVFYGYQTAVQSLVAATFTAVTIDTEVVDTYGGHSTTVSTSRYVCQLAGVYEVCGSGAIASSSGGLLITYTAKNGTEITGSRTATNPMTNHFTGLVAAPVYVSLAVNDYVELYIYSQTAVSTGTSPWSTLSVKFVHA